MSFNEKTIPDEECAPEERLWAAIIKTYFVDLAMYKRFLPSLANGSAQRFHDKIAELRFMLASRWGAHVCECAGVNHDYILRRFDESAASDTWAFDFFEEIKRARRET